VRSTVAPVIRFALLFLLLLNSPTWAKPDEPLTEKDRMLLEATLRTFLGESIYFKVIPTPFDLERCLSRTNEVEARLRAFKEHLKMREEKKQDSVPL
jgi:hypothetical protein